LLEKKKVKHPKCFDYVLKYNKLRELEKHKTVASNRRWSNHKCIYFIFQTIKHYIKFQTMLQADTHEKYSKA